MDPLEGLEPGSLGHTLVTRESQHEISFALNDELVKREKNRVSNFFPNPEPNWGPKKAASIITDRSIIGQPVRDLEDTNEEKAKEGSGANFEAMNEEN